MCIYAFTHDQQHLDLSQPVQSEALCVSHDRSLYVCMYECMNVCIYIYIDTYMYTDHVYLCMQT